MYVVGGLIVGNPDDTRESIEANLAFARQLRRLAVHPASDAVPADADDARVPRSRPDRRRGRVATTTARRRSCGRKASTRRDRIPALARRAVDEGAALAGRRATARDSCCGTGSTCSRTRSPAPALDRCSASRTSARCSIDFGNNARRNAKQSDRPEAAPTDDDRRLYSEMLPDHLVGQLAIGPPATERPFSRMQNSLATRRANGSFCSTSSTVTPASRLSLRMMSPISWTMLG